MRRVALLLGCVCLSVGSELALSDSTKDSDDAYSAHRPVAATYKKSPADADLHKTLRIKLAMAQLLWPVDLGVLKHPNEDPKFRDQLKALQSQMGVPATGALTVGQERILMSAADALLEHRVSGGSKKMVVVTKDKRFVSVRGSWSMEDMAFPINTTTVNCWLPNRMCIVSTANLDFDASGARLLGVTSDEYTIKSFSEGKLTAESQHPCGTATLAIDTSAETAKIVGVPDLVSDACEKLNSSKRAGHRERIQVVTLVDPWDASQKFFNARKAGAERLAYKANLKVFEIWK